MKYTAKEWSNKEWELAGLKEAQGLLEHAKKTLWRHDGMSRKVDLAHQMAVQCIQQVAGRIMEIEQGVENGVHTKRGVGIVDLKEAI